MAYQSQTGDPLCSSSGSLAERPRSGVSAYRHHCHSSSDILHGSLDPSQAFGFSSNENLPIGRHETRHSYPLSQWGHHNTDFRVEDLPYAELTQGSRREPLTSDNRLNQAQGNRNYFQQPQQSGPMSQDSGSNMASNITCNIPSKSKYSFGIYYPPKSSAVMPGSSSSGGGSRTISAESLGRGYEDPPEPPGISKSQTFEMNPRRTSSGARKTSLDESSALSSSARSREYFIRYSSDKAASDNRNRYSPRHSVYERYSSDNRPSYVISRSQTVGSISPTNTSSGGQPVKHTSEYMKSSQRGAEEFTSDGSRSRQYIPVFSESKQSSRSTGYSSYTRPLHTEQADSAPGSRTFVLRIPYDQQSQTQQGSKVAESNYNIPLRQNYGTTFALTRSPTATHIEIQKSIGKPIVSQRKHQFESGKNENTPPPGNGGYNRYKTEIEKIRTQPKFSSIAMRKASFESPERDPPGFDEPVELREQPPSDYKGPSVETAQPTVKVRKISTERYASGSPHHSGTSLDKPGSGGGSYQDSIRIYVSGNTHRPSSPSPYVEIMPMYTGDGTSRQVDTGQTLTAKNTSHRSSKDGGYFHSPSPSSLSAGSSSGGGAGGSDAGGTGLVDSGVWVKSYHGSSDMLDGGDGSSGVTDSGVFSVDGTSDQDGSSSRSNRPARKTSYLSAVNAPSQRNVVLEQQTALESRSNYVQTPQQLLAQSQALPYPNSQSSAILHPPRTLSPQPHPFGQSKGYSADGQSFSSLPSSGSSHSLSSMSSGSVPVASVPPTVMSASDSSVMPGRGEAPHVAQGSSAASYTDAGGSKLNVTMRKKLPESSEDQASKLHRRTSYLMATARDRTNTVPIEQAFSSPQVVTDHRPQMQPQTGVAKRHQSSVKLNKFFGENIPSIAEGLEKADQEEPPEVIRKGPLSCKISVIEGKKCSDRTWKPVYAVLRQNELYLTRDKEGGSASSNFEEQHIPLKSCMVEFARDYAKKKKNVFRVSTHNECEYLFQTEDRGTMLCWIQGIKSINEPEKAEKMEEMIASEREKYAPVEINIIPSSKLSPQMSHKGRKLSALSFKSKLASSPSMRRKKSNATEKEKDESFKKSWKGRIPMMKSLRKHNDDSNLNSLSEQDVDPDKMQFGMPLEDCFPSPHNEYVPLIVELCTRIVEARGLEVVGVYRVPGNSAAVNALTEEFNRGIDSVNIDNEKLLDINVISSLLKSFFRKLPEPLVPSESYDSFIEANRYPDEDKRKLKLKRLLHLLPTHHQETFKHMAEHLNKVASYGNINKMDAKNLAIMFGPTLVRKKGDDTVSLVTDMSDQCRIVESIILHHEWFFSPWDQDNYIPMETTVETVPVDDGQVQFKDDDEEADSAISTKEIISSIVGAASKKLRKQQQKSMESLDMVDSCSTITSNSTYKDHSIDDSVYLAALTKSLTSIASSRSASEEFLERKGSGSGTRYLDLNSATPITHSEPDFMELEYADATSPVSTGFSRHLSDDSLLGKNDELEIAHGMTTSLSRDAIHNTLKRIGNDVSALLHTFEQKQLKERERRRREQELIEREHRRTQLELEQEDNHTVEDWLAWKGNLTGGRMPDLVSSSYLGDNFPYEQGQMSSSAAGDKNDKKGRRGSKPNTEGSGPAGSNVASVPPQISAIAPTHLTVQQSKMPRTGSHENILSHPSSQRPDPGRPAAMRGPSQRKLQENQQRNMYVPHGGVIQRPPSLRQSWGRRHGSLDSLIDMIDKQDKRASWASSDSEDGSDLLTSITTTFDQKLQILLNPKYKLTGASKKPSRTEVPSSTEGPRELEALRDSLKSKSTTSVNPKQVYTVAALLDSDRPFRDPSLHRSARSDPKIGIASRFERTDMGRAASASPVTTSDFKSQSRKGQLPDFKAFLGRSASPSKDVEPVVLTQPKKLESSTKLVRTNSKNGKTDSKPISKSEKTERNWNLARLSKEGKFYLGEKDSDNADDQGKESSQGKKLGKKREHRRHTVGGVEDFDHIYALSQLCGEQSQRGFSTRGHGLSAWEQLRPAVTDQGTPGPQNMQAWIQRERLRGSTPDLSCQEKQ